MIKNADYEFTVKAASETGATESANLQQSTTVVNNAGSTLPSTGVTGTIAFKRGRWPRRDRRRAPRDPSSYAAVRYLEC